MQYLRIINLILINLFLFFNLKGQLVKSDLTIYNLNGNVKRVIETKYDLIDSCGQFKKAGLTSDIVINSFNQHGNLSERIDSNPLVETINRFKFNYDEKEVCHEINYNLSLLDIKGKQTLEYDKKGNIIELDDYQYGILLSTTHYYYNTKGELKEMKRNTGSKNNFKIKYRYCHNGHKKSEIFATERKSKEKRHYKYDAVGRIIKIIDCHRPNKPLKVIYGYDSLDNMGNWILRSEFLNGKPATITERKIEYF